MRAISRNDVNDEKREIGQPYYGLVVTNDRKNGGRSALKVIVLSEKRLI